MTTLDDLKRAIERKEFELTNPRGSREESYDAEIAALKCAFKWRDGFRNIDGLNRDRLEEYDEGMRLIAEHLK